MTQPEDTVHSRLKLLVEKLGHNQNSFAVKTGISPTAILNIAGRRESKPSHDVLYKIKTAFPKVNLNWLVYGTEYHMFEDTDVNTSIAYEPLTTYGDSQKIPVISQRAAANALHGIEANEAIEVSYNIELPHQLTGSGTFVAIPVRGTSMQPVIMDGSIVVMRRLEREEWHNFKQGWIYMIYTEAYGAQIKYLKRSSRNNMFWIMESENNMEHQTLSVDVREVLQLWEWKLTIGTKFVSLRNSIYEKIDALEAGQFELSQRVDKLEQKKSNGS